MTIESAANLIKLVESAGILVTLLVISAVTALGIFQWMGKGWIEKRFAKELEHHRMEVNSLFDRVTKIQDKEFEVLPTLWEQLWDARQKAERVTSRGQLTLDVASLAEETFEELLRDSGFLESHKKKLRQTDGKDRQELYQDLVYHYRSNDAWNAVNKVHRYIQRNKLFLHEEVYKLVEKLDYILWSALDEHRDYRHARLPVKVQGDDGELEYERFDFKKLVDNIGRIMAEVEQLIRHRLHYHDAV